MRQSGLGKKTGAETRPDSTDGLAVPGLLRISAPLAVDVRTERIRCFRNDVGLLSLLSQHAYRTHVEIVMRRGAVGGNGEGVLVAPVSRCSSFRTQFQDRC